MAAATSLGLASRPLNRLGIPGSISATGMGCCTAHLCAWFAEGPGTAAMAIFQHWRMPAHPEPHCTGGAVPNLLVPHRPGAARRYPRPDRSRTVMALQRQISDRSSRHSYRLVPLVRQADGSRINRRGSDNSHLGFEYGGLYCTAGRCSISGLSSSAPVHALSTLVFHCDLVLRHGGRRRVRTRSDAHFFGAGGGVFYYALSGCE